MNYENIYRWKYIFNDGSIVTKESNATLSRKKRIDPNNPGKKVKKIILIPTHKDFFPVEVLIPDGCFPVYAMEKVVANLGRGNVEKIIFKIGFNFRGIRNMICVDVMEKKIFQKIDSLGIK